MVGENLVLKALTSLEQGEERKDDSQGKSEPEQTVGRYG